MTKPLTDSDNKHGEKGHSLKISCLKCFNELIESEMKKERQSQKQIDKKEFVEMLKRLIGEINGK